VKGDLRVAAVGVLVSVGLGQWKTVLHWLAPNKYRLR